VQTRRGTRGAGTERDSEIRGVKSADEKEGQDDEHGTRYEMNENNAEPVNCIVVRLNTDTIKPQNVHK